MKTPGNLLNRSLCDLLIIILITSFVFQAILSLLNSPQLINQIFAFGLNNFFNGYLWTPITYGFIHDGPLHLLANLIGIHFIGRPVEYLLGRKKFQTFCICSLLFGLLAWLPANASSHQYIVGSSAIVLGALCIFCLSRPNQPITLLLFFILPLTIKPKWVLWGTLGLELYGFATVELSGYGGIAHSAHLGGMLCGLLFYLSIVGSLNLPFRFKFTTLPPQTNFPKSEKPHSKFHVNFKNTTTIQEETDKILDKINEKGFGSLTDQEKETLEKAKKLLDK
ncbi:MAG: rhomboid family intramembrane serine protease [Opitutae bacterium]